MTPFKKWSIDRYSSEDSIYGDLARDMARDDMFPDDATEFSVIEDYLISQGACKGCLDAFKELYLIYLADKLQEQIVLW